MGVQIPQALFSVPLIWPEFPLFPLARGQAHPATPVTQVSQQGWGATHRLWVVHGGGGSADILACDLVVSASGLVEMGAVT